MQHTVKQAVRPCHKADRLGHVTSFKGPGAALTRNASGNIFLVGGTTLGLCSPCLCSRTDWLHILAAGLNSESLGPLEFAVLIGHLFIGAAQVDLAGEQATDLQITKPDLASQTDVHCRRKLNPAASMLLQEQRLATVLTSNNHKCIVGTSQSFADVNLPDTAFLEAQSHLHHFVEWEHPMLEVMGALGNGTDHHVDPSNLSRV